jgi:hypothetical protein
MRRVSLAAAAALMNAPKQSDREENHGVHFGVHT